LQREDVEFDRLFRSNRFNRLADDLKTIDGKEYKQVTVSRVESDGIVIIHSFGVTKVPLTDLPKDLQERFGHDAAKVEAEKAAQKAAEEKRIEEKHGAERERTEMERKAEADLMRCKEQFETAERSAAQSYASSAKGNLSGQVFVASKGGENFKLGALQVSVFARDAMDILLAGLKAYRDAKFDELQLAAAEKAEQRAKAAEKQAEVTEQQAKETEKIDWDAYQKLLSSNDARQTAEGAKAAADAASAALNAAREAVKAARQRHDDLLRQKAFYYSGSFYFNHLRSPIEIAETDAEGKFLIKVPQTGEFVIGAEGKRSIGEKTERYYWLQPVSLEGQQQRVQNLSNSNLTSAIGTTSLVFTSN
jgi:hypothetical protein